MDRLTPRQRSELMSRIRGRDTAPEIFVRRIVHGLGYRYRLHDRRLPGRPDLVFPRLRKVIFVHGCFWHSHRCKKGLSAPKTNVPFWARKREANRVRDRKSQRRLRSLGWDVLVIWECRCGKSENVVGVVEKYLEERII